MEVPHMESKTDITSYNEGADNEQTTLYKQNH